MLENASSSSPYPANYLLANQTVHTNIYQENRKNPQQEEWWCPVDRVSLTYSSTTEATYNRSLSLTGKNDGYDLLRGLVLNMFRDQGIEYTITIEDAEIDLRAVSPEKARELIEEEGYFGVEKTSERIFKFAVGLAGGDPARIEAIKQGVENGFQEAMEAFGGWLPDISHTTYDTVMQKLDDWAGIDNTNSSPEPQTQVKS